MQKYNLLYGLHDYASAHNHTHIVSSHAHTVSSSPHPHPHTTHPHTLTHHTHTHTHSHTPHTLTHTPHTLTHTLTQSKMAKLLLPGTGAQLVEDVIVPLTNGRPNAP